MFIYVFIKELIMDDRKQPKAEPSGAEKRRRIAPEKKRKAER